VPALLLLLLLLVVEEYEELAERTGSAFCSGFLYDKLEAGVELYDEVDEMLELPWGACLRLLAPSAGSADGPPAPGGGGGLLRRVCAKAA